MAGGDVSTMVANRTTLRLAAGLGLICSSGCRHAPRAADTSFGGTPGLPRKVATRTTRNPDLLPEAKPWRESPASGPLGRIQGRSLTPPELGYSVPGLAYKSRGQAKSFREVRLLVPNAPRGRRGHGIDFRDAGQPQHKCSRRRQTAPTNCGPAKPYTVGATPGIHSRRQIKIGRFGAPNPQEAIRGPHTLGSGRRTCAP